MHGFYENAPTFLSVTSHIADATWKKEQVKLTAERVSLAEKYYHLKDDIKSAEILRRGFR